MILLTMLFYSGCGKPKVPAIDTAPFEQAIKKYLAAKQMDMKVSKFREIKVDGNKASAECSMKAASDIAAGPAVCWSFTFEKKDGTWRVTGLKQ